MRASHDAIGHNIQTGGAVDSCCELLFNPRCGVEVAFPGHVEHVAIRHDMDETDRAAVAQHDLFALHPAVSAPVSDPFDADACAFQATTPQPLHDALFDRRGECCQSADAHLPG